MSTRDANGIDPQYQYIRLRPDGKAPIGKDAGFGAKDAATWERRSVAAIRDHVAGGGNVAVLTGKRSGHVCVDVDPSGLELAETFDWPETTRIETPRGGYHLLFRYPTEFDRVENDTHGILLGEGIDFKADYGYRVAPPSSTSKGVYTLVNDLPPAPCPDWLIERIRQRAKVREAKQARARAFEEVEKEADPAACCSEFARSSVRSILAKMDELAALPDGARLKLRGQLVGWDGGYWLLAARLVEIARWPHTRYSLKRAHADFVAHAPTSDAGFDPDHAWEQGANAATTWLSGERHTLEEHTPPVTAFDPKDLGIIGGLGQSLDSNRPYSVLLNSESAVFAQEFADRQLRIDGSLALRWQPEEADWWAWDEAKGHYVLVHPDRVVKRVKTQLRGARQTAKDQSHPEVLVNNRSTGELVKALQIEVTPDGDHDKLLPARGGIPFRNGWLETDTRMLVPLGPDRDVRWVIPADYNSEAGCPEWLAFLASLELADDELRLLRQWFGYLLSGRVDLHKALMLVGPKRAGKGTIIEVAAALLGDGVGAVGIDSFDPKNSFALETLIGKSLGVIGDARWGIRQNPGRNETLLKWISADLISVNVKYKPHATHRPTARLMIASNELPKVVDADGALVSRFVVIELQNSFYRKEDFNLKERLLAELPGIANWAMDGLADLSEVGRFSETLRGREIEEELDAASRPEAMFVNDQCEFGQDLFVTKEELYFEYRRWCSDNGYFAVDRSTMLGRIYRDFRGKIAQRRIGSRDNRERVVGGIRINPGKT